MKELAGVYVITGNGKGKTTTALGYAVKALWHREKTVVIQFLKGGGYTGELESARRLKPWLEIYQFGHGCPISDRIRQGNSLCTACGLCFRENRRPENRYARQAMDQAWQVLRTGNMNWLVLDEISHALRRKLIDSQEVLKFLSLRPPAIGVILTGRNMPADIMKQADFITECQAFRHPMTQGIAARRGSEY